MGGIQLENLSLSSKQIQGWFEQRNIWVFATYISFQENSETDAESRSLKSNTEFKLTERAFYKVISELGIPEIDLFATRANAKCGGYVSWKIDPAFVASDAFTIPWSAEFFYAFPPFSLILRVLQKIKQEKATGIVIVPNWPAQPWFPTFQSMLSSKPVLLRADTNVSLPFDREKPSFWRKLILVAGILSGKYIK